MVLTPDNGLVDRAAEWKRIERDRRVGAERLANLLHVRRIPAQIGRERKSRHRRARRRRSSRRTRPVSGVRSGDRTAAPRASFAAAPRFSAALRPPATGTLAHCAQPPLCEGAAAAASAKANKAELSAVPRQVSEGRKSTARPAATWEASRRTTDMTVLFTSLDYPAII